MEVALTLIEKVAVFFMMMIPGVILKKCNMISDGFGKGLSNLVLYIAQPVLVFLAYLRDYDKEIMINSLYVLVFSVITHSLFAVVSGLAFRKAPDGQSRMLRFATIFSNAAFMGIPLISAMLEGDPTSSLYFPGATLYASIYNITFNLFLWSLGVSICTKGRDENADGVDDYKEVSKITPSATDDEKVKDGSGSIMKALLHPVTIAAAIGLVFFITPLNGYVPALIENAFTDLKNLVAPLSMVVIGIRLADMSFKGMHKDLYMYVFLALRHLILPIAVVGIIKLCGLIIPIHPAVEMVIVIMSAAPAASSATMFAEKFDCDAIYVSRLVTLSTLLSIITMPLVLLLV